MDNNNPDMGEESVGLRFRPTEEELVTHYLRIKIHHNMNADDMIPDIDIRTTPPWKIPPLIIGSSPYQKDPDNVYFFCRIQFMNPSSRKRVQRKDDFGYWKGTGQGRTVKKRDRRTVIGRKNILVYKKDDDPDDAPTEYTMHEYHLNDDLAADAPTDTRDFVLCAMKRNWDKLANGCSPRKKGKGKGKRAALEVPDEETPKAKKVKAKKRARKATDGGSPNSIICPELSPTGCNVISAAEKQIVKEPIAVIMQKNITVSNPSAVESPQSILSRSSNSPNISPALSPREEAPFHYTEVPSSNEISPKKPGTPHEVCNGDTLTAYEENPHQDFMESSHTLASANTNHFPLHHMQTESGADSEYPLPEYLQAYFCPAEPPRNIFQLLGNSSCSVLFGGVSNSSHFVPL